MQSSDRLLGQGVDGGLLSAPKGQQEAGEEKEEDRSLLIDIQQTVTYCPHYQQGCFHWVMLADTQESLLFCSGNSCKTPVATVRLFAPACVFLCAPRYGFILHFLSHGKGSKHKPQMAEPRLSFGEIQLCSGLESLKVKKAERGEKEMDLAGNEGGN